MIDFAQIPADGIRLGGSTEEFSIGNESLLRAAKWNFFIMPSPPDFFISIQGDAKLVSSCSRCLESADLTITVDSQFMCSRDANLKVGGNYILKKQDLDVVFFSGEALNEEAIIFEQFQLQVPSHIICSDTCKGLCLKCGNNLNQSRCACSPEVPEKSGALANALKGLKLNPNNS